MLSAYYDAKKDSEAKEELKKQEDQEGQDEKLKEPNEGDNEKDDLLKAQSWDTQVT